MNGVGPWLGTANGLSTLAAPATTVGAVNHTEVLSFVAWAYLLSNATRVLTYVPQIVAVWRCPHGAISVSLMTWGSWAASNLTAVLYGAWVVDDGFFVAISVINLVGCGAVTLIVCWKRVSWRRAKRAGQAAGAT